jgi:N-acetylhexosamine 1-kinase
MTQPSPAILAQFGLTGTLRSLQPLKRGHINETYISAWAVPGGGGTKRFVHQRINGFVFRDIPLLMRNIDLITNHLRAGGERTLTVVPTQTGEFALLEREPSPDGAVHGWRTYEYVEGTIALDIARTPADAEKVAAAFGRFDRILSSLDPARIGTPIPRFQDTVWRFEQLADAASNDSARRTSGVEREIAFARSHLGFVNDVVAAQASGDVRLRVTHADPKINNCLLDQRTEEVVCIVDLDTCMPGSVLWDFGDLARNTAVLCAEDEPDLSKVTIDSKMYQAVLAGFLSEMGELLTAAERSLLPSSAALLALTLGVRFLTDYLNGDKYFKINHPEHNLQRARTQLHLAQTILEREKTTQPNIGNAR